jgi:hypothetical protein
VLPQNQSLKPFSIEDTSSLLLRIGKCSDEVPATFSAINHQLNDSAIIYQVKSRNYSVNGRFFSETIQKKPTEPISKVDLHSFTYFLLLIVPVIISLWIFKSSFSRIQGAFKAAFTNRHSSIFIRTYSLSNHFSTYLIYFNSLLLMSLTVWLYLNHSFKNRNEEHFILFAIIFAALTGYFLFRYIVIQYVGILFHNKESSVQYLYRDYYFKTVIAIVLSPMLLVSAYGPLSFLMLNIAASIIILLFIYQTIQSFYHGISEREYGLLYFILYFCTVEIVPVLIVLKLISAQIFDC